MAAHVNKPSSLILASASPRRSELLERMGLAFEICPTNTEEIEFHANGPAALVLQNAALKANALTTQHRDSLILGSDTTVALGADSLGKPADLDEARAMLKRLSGRAHTVFTAVALRWATGKVSCDFVESSEVRFRELDDALIEAYFKLVNPLDKAGGYGIQVGRELIIESVDGSVESVMGLPVQALRERFDRLGFDFDL